MCVLVLLTQLQADDTTADVDDDRPLLHRRRCVDVCCHNTATGGGRVRRVRQCVCVCVCVCVSVRGRADHLLTTRPCASARPSDTSQRRPRSRADHTPDDPVSTSTTRLLRPHFAHPHTRPLASRSTGGAGSTRGPRGRRPAHKKTARCCVWRRSAPHNVERLRLTHSTQTQTITPLTRVADVDRPLAVVGRLVVVCCCLADSLVRASLVRASSGDDCKRTPCVPKE